MSYGSTKEAARKRNRRRETPYKKSTLLGPSVKKGKPLTFVKGDVKTMSDDQLLLAREFQRAQLRKNPLKHLGVGAAISVPSTVVMGAKNVREVLPMLGLGTGFSYAAEALQKRDVEDEMFRRGMLKESSSVLRSTLKGTVGGALAGGGLGFLGSKSPGSAKRDRKKEYLKRRRLRNAAYGATIGGIGGGFLGSAASISKRRLKEYSDRLDEAASAWEEWARSAGSGRGGSTGGFNWDDDPFGGFGGGGGSGRRRSRYGSGSAGSRWRSGFGGIGKDGKSADQVWKAMGGTGPTPTTKKEWKKFYRKQAMKYHPDRHAMKSPEEQKAAADKFKEVSGLYDDLEKATFYWDKLGSVSLSAFFAELRSMYHGL